MHGSLCEPGYCYNDVYLDLCQELEVDSGCLEVQWSMYEQSKCVMELRR